MHFSEFHCVRCCNDGGISLVTENVAFRRPFDHFKILDLTFSERATKRRIGVDNKFVYCWQTILPTQYYVFMTRVHTVRRIRRKELMDCWNFCCFPSLNFRGQTNVRRGSKSTKLQREKFFYNIYIEKILIINSRRKLLGRFFVTRVQF